MTYEIEDFETDIIAASQDVPVVVDFWAPWCGPCTALGPILEKLAAEANGAWKLVKVNVDENPQLSQMFQVQSIPYVVMVDKAQGVSAFNGAIPESQLREWLAEHVPALGEVEVEPEEVEVEAEPVPTSDEELKAHLAQKIADDEGDHASRLALARHLIFSDPETAGSLLAAIPDDAGEHHESSCLIGLTSALTADVSALPGTESIQGFFTAAMDATRAQNFGEALDQFLEVMYRDNKYHEDLPRKAMLGIFTYLGRDHELSKAYQRRFEMAVYS